LRRREVGLETGLATAVLKVGELASLLEPSALAVGPGGVDAPEPGAATRFNCYDVAPTKPKRADVPRPFRAATLAVTDALVGEAHYRIGKPRRLCVPETPEPAAGGAPPAPHRGYLVCHKARAKPRSVALSALVSTANACGAELLQAEGIRELCLPGLSWIVPPDVRPFPFLFEKDPVSEAMKTIWEHSTRSPSTASEARTAFAGSEAARLVLEQSLPEAQAALMAALRTLGPSDLGLYASLGTLLEIAGQSAEILAHLQGVAMAPGGLPTDRHDPPPDELVRHVAMGVLTHHARLGNAEAKARVLGAAASPHPDVRAAAVRTYLGLALDRRHAQRELRERLDPESHHLLWQE
jgi:hypothetical protein